MSLLLEISLTSFIEYPPFWNILSGFTQIPRGAFWKELCLGAPYP